MALAFWTRISEADMVGNVMRIPNALIRNVPEYYLANFYLVMPTHELWDVIIFQGRLQNFFGINVSELVKGQHLQQSGNEIAYPVKILMSISCHGSWKYILHLPKREVLRVFGGESKSITLWRNHPSMPFKVEYTIRESKNGSMNLVSLVTKITVRWFKFVKFYGIEKGDLITFQKIDHKGTKFFVSVK
ncbi:hypothetical protein GH714_028162 [Hevea brasiliensis]|uniref:TF-B3 domain-containing protein n=1 Tax=Hevea brasiliensis TaxID=3981 RepID=A0A6A6LWX2_HEVBR|nr:hypothetical protein GH714_028162 [Hevea brasiliensis]